MVEFKRMWFCVWQENPVFHESIECHRLDEEPITPDALNVAQVRTTPNDRGEDCRLRFCRFCVSDEMKEETENVV